MKVSVIVAAYNAEKYVTETMESLANQSIDDYEIIVVNDGSKDHTINSCGQREWWTFFGEKPRTGFGKRRVCILL